MEAEHNHPKDSSFYPDCKRCKLEQAAPELLAACKELIKLTLDQFALTLNKQGQIDDLCSALTVCTAQFNSAAAKQAMKAIAKAE